jgi:signal transduction histidine kinase/CheY-like chemotaxis protein
MKGSEQTGHSPDAIQAAAALLIRRNGNRVAGRTFALRRILALLVLATMLPLGLFAGLLVTMSWRQQIAVVDRQNVDNARAIAVAVDKEVESTVDSLEVLAAIEELQRADLAAMRALAVRLISRQPGWHAVLLSDRTGRLLVNASNGSHPPPAPGMDWAGEVLRTQRPAVTDLFRDPASGRYYVIVAIPVMGEGALQFVLGAQVRSTIFSEVLSRQKLPPNGVVTLIDRAHHIVARTRNEDQYVGQLPAQSFHEAATRMSEGSWRSVLLEGQPSYSALSRSALTGWTIGVGLPADEIDGPIRRSMWALAAVGIVMLLAGLACALLLGQMIVRALGNAAQSARALASSEPLPEQRSPIGEIEELSAGLRDAAAILTKRLYERDQAEAARMRASAEREQALAAEQAARGEAEAASRSKDEFVATISHELRTPLNAMFGWVRLLRGGSLDENGRARALEVIERNTRAQAQLIEDLLDMSRAIRGNLRLDVQETDLCAVVHAAVDALRPSASEKRLTLNATCPEKATVLGDQARLQQIVWNLITNAIKFTPAGGRVDVGIDVSGAEAIVSVTDTGIGIDPEFLPHVFERFSQAGAPDKSSRGGLGLGLSLVRHLVELHRGNVAAFSAGRGQGTRFEVHLPVVVPADPPATADAEVTAPQQEQTPSLEGVRVLAVDDDGDTLDLLRTALAQAGAEVTVARSLREALDVMETRDFDVLLSDIAMPNGSGYDLVRAVRMNPLAIRIPAIAVTGQNRPEDHRLAMSAGFDYHLAKPFELARLIKTVALAVGR